VGFIHLHILCCPEFMLCALYSNAYVVFAKFMLCGLYSYAYVVFAKFMLCWAEFMLCVFYSCTYIYTIYVHCQ
jgi:hypothetical protein